MTHNDLKISANLIHAPLKFYRVFIAISDIQFRRNQTKTTNKEPMSQFAREYLEKGPMSYEVDFYWFVRQLFNERIRALGITPSTNLDT